MNDWIKALVGRIDSPGYRKLVVFSYTLVDELTGMVYSGSKLIGEILPSCTLGEKDTITIINGWIKEIHLLRGDTYYLYVLWDLSSSQAILKTSIPSGLVYFKVGENLQLSNWKLNGTRMLLRNHEVGLFVSPDHALEW